MYCIVSTVLPNENLMAKHYFLEFFSLMSRFYILVSLYVLIALHTYLFNLLSIIIGVGSGSSLPTPNTCVHDLYKDGSRRVN